MTKPATETSAPDTGGVLRKAGRAVLRTGVTLGVLAAAALTVQTGASELSRRADAAPTPAAAPVLPVAVTPLALEDGYDVTRSFIGQVEPQKTVAMSFELAGKLADIQVDEGDTVRAGQILATQDLALLQAERDRLDASRDATEARLRFALQTVERLSALNERGHTSQAGLDEALAQEDELRAHIAEIDAARVSVDIQIGKSTLTAPFDGRVTDRQVDGGETLSAGQPVLELVQLSRPQVRVGVPLDLDAADLTEAEIEIGGVMHAARLLALRPDVDPVTRTRTALFEMDTDQQPAFGQTARLTMRERVPSQGIWVPVTSLKEGLRGQWTVLAVDEARVVRALAVHVLHAESDRVFVQGAFPDGTLLIGAGPHRVTVGQTVTLPDTL